MKVSLNNDNIKVSLNNDKLQSFAHVFEHPRFCDQLDNYLNESHSLFIRKSDEL